MASGKSSIVIISLGMGLMLTLLYFAGATSSGSEVPDNPSVADPWGMTTISINGTRPEPVWDGGYTLTLNSTEISGSTCNGFAGSIEYLDDSTIRGASILFTAMLCTATPGIMEVEEPFIDGLRHGMAVTETDNALELRDVVTNTTFVYSRSS